MPYLWAEQHQPSTEADLVVAKKKIGEVKDFLGSSAHGRRLLVLKGPAGCGKASVLCCLAADLGFELVEWSPAMRGSRSQASAQPAGESLADAFLRFVAQADRYRCLEPSSSSASSSSDFSRPASRPRIALVRDFPFTLLESGPGEASKGSSVFIERFTAMVNSGAVQRAVFCFNDAREDHKLVTRLLAHVDSRAVATVMFDSVPRTFAQRALDGAARAEGLPPGAVDTLALSMECGGDLRHAMNALQLAAGGVSRVAVNGTGRGGRGRGKIQRQPSRGEEGDAEKASPVDSGLRPQSLGIFHALGRLLWCKRVPPTSPGIVDLEIATPVAEGLPAAKRRKKTAAAVGEPKQLAYEQLVPKARRPPLYFVPEEVIANSSVEAGMLVNWLFTNAPRFYGDIGDLAEFSASLAESDVWGSSSSSGWSPSFQGSQAVSGFALEELAASVQVRSLLDANLHPVPPSFNDPFGAQSHSESSGPSGGLAFNMARPLMWDVARHRNRRQEELAGLMATAGPLALGSLSASPRVVLRTLPFVHLLLVASRGAHASLRNLPHALMKLIMDLSAPIDGETLRAGVAEASQARSQFGGGHDPDPGEKMPATWVALPEDPIEEI